MRGSMAHGGSLDVVIPKGCGRLHGSGHQRIAAAARMRWQENDLPRAGHDGIAGVDRRSGRNRTVIQVCNVDRMRWHENVMPRPKLNQEEARPGGGQSVHRMVEDSKKPMMRPIR